MPSEIVPAPPVQNQEVAPTRALVQNQGATLGDLRFASDTELIRVATEKADAVSRIIDEQKLYEVIGGKKCVGATGWLTLLPFVGLSVRECEVRQEADGKTWSAWVELVSRSTGEVVGRASSSCSPDEPKQSGKPSFQLRSMAITRATTRVCKQQLAWVMSLKGYSVADEGGDEVSGAGDQSKQHRVTDEQLAAIAKAFSDLPHAISRARIEKCVGPLEQMPEESVALLRRAVKKLKAIEDHDKFWEEAEKLLPENPF